MSREQDAKAYYARAMERLENPIIDKRQQIEAGTEVYIRPIYHTSKLHFYCDLITKVEGTYAQLYPDIRMGGVKDDDFKNYSLEVASWYDENEIMPTNGKTLKECRDKCEEYFSVSYEKMLKLRTEAKENDPFMKMMRKSMKGFFDQYDQSTK